MKRAVKECVLATRPGITSPVWPEHFEMRSSEVDLSSIAKGNIVCETKYLSVDPYMRCMFDEGHPQLGEYLTTFKLGEALSGGGVGTVLASATEQFKEGDTVCVPFQGYPWSTVASFNPTTTQAFAVPPDTASHYLGALGIPGLTAYFGFYEACTRPSGHPTKSDVIVVSGAAGATGTIFCQLARQHSCTVIGICGSQDKCDYLSSLGVVPLNYKADTFEADLAAAAESAGGVDIYFDNVGGKVSDLVIAHMNIGGIIPICGQIAVYSEDVPYPPPLGTEVQAYCDAKNIKRFRYLCLNYEERFTDATMSLGKMMQEGKLAPKETITEGFRPHEGFVDMMNGGNTGKAVVRV